jgi:hypothetical protein
MSFKMARFFFMIKEKQVLWIILEKTCWLVLLKKMV